MYHEKDKDVVMKLFHYFVTVENYTPVALKGAKNEIWLEKLDSEYKIIRIVSNYIHNDEQLTFDIYRTKRILKDIKKKTFTLNIPTLSIFTNLGDSVNVKTVDNVHCAHVTNRNDLNNYSFIKESFPSIYDKLNFMQTGPDLLNKVTHEINEKSRKDNKKTDNLFKMETPYVTIFIIVINVIIHLLATSNNAILDYGVLSGEAVRNGEIYRLITGPFLHADNWHLVFNMYALFMIGKQLESFFGMYKYAIIYFVSAIFGSLLSITVVPDVYSVGASGAIFGLLGSLLFFGYRYRIYLGTVLRNQIVPLTIINLLLGFTSDGIDNGAHIGGLIGGILITGIVGIPNKDNPTIRRHASVIAVIVFLFLNFLIFFYS